MPWHFVPKQAILRSVESTKVLGTEVETDGTGGGYPNFGLNHLEAGKCTTFTAQAWYDQIKFSLGAAAGNVRVGLYDNNAGAPNNLLGESASLTAVANYTTNYPITECQVLATTAWITHNQDSNGSQWNFWDNGTGIRYYRSGFAYSAFPNPWGGTDNDTNNAPKMKASHS